MTLKDIVHGINVIISNAKPEIISVTLTAGTYQYEHYNTEVSGWTFYPMLEITTSEKLNIVDVYEEFIKAFPDAKYFKVYPKIQIEIKAEKKVIKFINEIFPNLLIVEKDGELIYPTKAKEIIKTNDVFRSLFLKGEIIA